MRHLVIRLEDQDETLRWTAATPYDRRMLQRQVAREAHAVGAPGIRVISHDGKHVLWAATFKDAPVESDKNLESVFVPMKPKP